MNSEELISLKTGDMSQSKTGDHHLKDAERDELAAQIAEFQKGGGVIEVILGPQPARNVSCHGLSKGTDVIKKRPPKSERELTIIRVREVLEKSNFAYVYRNGDGKISVLRAKRTKLPKWELLGEYAEAVAVRKNKLLGA